MSRQTRNRAPTLVELLAELYRELTSLDSRVWRTLRDLVRPGVMAADWQAGRREHVFPPIRLYLIGSALYFLTGGGILFSELVSRDISELVSGSEAAGLSSRFLHDAVYTRTVGWIAISRALTLIPFALLLALVWPRRKPRVAPAFVLSMHFYTLGFLLSALSAAVWLPVQYWQPEWSATTVGSNALYFERGLLLVWLVLSLRRLTSRSWLTCILAGALLSWFDHWMLHFAAFGMVTGFTHALIAPMD